MNLLSSFTLVLIWLFFTLSIALSIWHYLNGYWLWKYMHERKKTSNDCYSYSNNVIVIFFTVRKCCCAFVIKFLSLMGFYTILRSMCCIYQSAVQNCITLHCVMMIFETTAEIMLETLLLTINYPYWIMIDFSFDKREKIHYNDLKIILLKVNLIKKVHRNNLIFWE